MNQQVSYTTKPGYLIVEIEKFQVIANDAIKNIMIESKIEYDNLVDEYVADLLESNEKFKLVFKLIGLYKSFDQLVAIAKKRALSNPTLTMLNCSTKIELINRYLRLCSNPHINHSIMIDNRIYDEIYNLSKNNSVDA